jgi:signal peptidase II
LETIIIEKKTGLYWLWLSALVIVIDQVTKHIVTTYLFYNQSLYLCRFLNITLAHNSGAAFNFLSEMGYLAVWLFIAIAFFVSLILCIWLRSLPAKNCWLGISLALILGGAIGNLLDRIFIGYVIDFIQFHVDTWSYPIFNMADTAISIGTFMLVIDIFRKKS